MINEKLLHNLRQRAEDVLLSRSETPSANKNLFELVEELNLYQIELKIQNEDLLKNQLELQALHDKYFHLYNTAPVAYFTFNEDGLVVNANQEALNMLGMEQDVLINRCFLRYIAPEFQILFAQFRQRALKEMTPLTCEVKLQGWCGPAFFALLTLKATLDAASGEKQILCCAKDISVSKLLDQTLHLQQIKMSSIDRFRSMSEQIYSISNSQTNSITLIDNYIYGCIRRLEDGKFCKEELLKSMKKVAQESRVLSNIVLQMKTFTSRSTMHYNVTTVNALIDEIEPLINYEIIDFFVQIQIDMLTDLPSIKLDKLHIQHAILNLARNSIEAMRDAKTIEPKLLIEVRMVGQHTVEICLLDNGPGFDNSIAHKVFEPHFTTKHYAMGLGLCVSRTIIDRHGGELTAKINPTGGACFKISLPCVAHIPVLETTLAL